MARQLRIQYPGAYYHVTSRGNERQKIYRDDSDHQDLPEKTCRLPERGEKFKSNNFNGTVWLNMLTPLASALPIANVTFEPGCRNNWHKHLGGQILLVTGSRGFYQEWEKPAQELHKVMLGAALNVGVTPVEVKEIVYQSVPYAGIARAFDFIHTTNDIQRTK